MLRYPHHSFSRRFFSYTTYILRNPYLTKTFKMTLDKHSSNNEISKEIFKPIVWIDCEMTGLDHINDHIIEICCIITDGNLNFIDENGYESVIHHNKSTMDSMSPWCVEHHGKSGLTARVINSVKTRAQVENELLNYIQRYIKRENLGILAGNSIHMDRLFMLREFPKVIDYLFYRIIDVSSIMEISYRHNPELAKSMKRKKGSHTARSDILESIEQLKFYQEHYLKSPEETKEFVAMRRKEKAEEDMKRQETTLSSLANKIAPSNKRDLDPQSEKSPIVSELDEDSNSAKRIKLTVCNETP